MTGKTYRLLTEAEWEYAARGGTATAYSWGDEIGKGNANCNRCGSEWDNRLSPVGSFKANGFGLLDMEGNVYQWVRDCYHSNYEGQPPTDGSAWTSDDCENRVVRGGWYSSEPRQVRAAFRWYYSPSIRYTNLGFRVARDLTR